MSLTSRVGLMVAGWWLAMSFPKDDSATQMALALLCGTFGVVLVGLVAYDWGRSRSEHP